MSVNWFKGFWFNGPNEIKGGTTMSECPRCAAGDVCIAHAGGDEAMARYATVCPTVHAIVSGGGGPAEVVDALIDENRQLGCRITVLEQRLKNIRDEAKYCVTGCPDDERYRASFIEQCATDLTEDEEVK